MLGDDLQKSIPRDLLPSRSHILRYPQLPPNNHQLLHKPVDHESPGDISSKTYPTPEPHPLGEAVQGKLLPLWVTEEPEGKPGRTRTKSSRSIRQSKSPANPNHHPKGHRRTGMMTQCSGATCRLLPPPPPPFPQLTVATDSSKESLLMGFFFLRPPPSAALDIPMQ